MAPATAVLACLPTAPGPAYVPRDPARTAFYGLVAEQRATFVAATSGDGGAPSFVHEAFERRAAAGA